MNKNTIEKEFSKLQEGVAWYQDKYNDVMYYCFNTENAGFKLDKNTPRVCDSTALDSSEILVNDIVSMLNPQGVEFLDAVINKKVEKKIIKEQFNGNKALYDKSYFKRDLLLWVESVRKRLFYVLNEKSNYYVANANFVEDFIIGTACQLIQKGENGTVNFITLCPSEYAFDTDIFDQPVKFIRKKEVEFKKLTDKYNINKNLFKPEDEVSVFDVACKVDGKWEYKLILKAKNEDIEIKEATREFKYCPFVLNRYATYSKNKYGRGLFIKALPIIKRLNIVAYNEQLILEYLAKPMLGVNQKLKRSVSFKPGTSIKINNKDDIIPLNLQGNPEASAATRGDLQRQVKSILKAQSVYDLQADRTTAYQVSAAQNEKRKSLINPFNRLAVESKNTFKRILEIVYYEDDFEDFEKEGFKVSWEDIEFKFNTELSQTQDRIEADEVLQTIGVTLQTFGLEETMRKINTGRVLEDVFDKRGIDRKYLNTKEEEKEFEEKMAAMQNAQNQQKGNN